MNSIDPMASLQLTDDAVLKRIYMLRGKRVMLDSDLATLYHVETKVLNQAVKRNLNRFPEDFMFIPEPDEWENMRSQCVTSCSSSPLHGGRRYLPYVFTEQGVAMLSSVLKSESAILVNIQIIRVFTRMRELMITNKTMLQKIAQIENTLTQNGNLHKKHEKDILTIFNLLKELIYKPEKPRKRIGFRKE